MARRKIGREVRSGAGKQLCLVFPNGWGGRRQGSGRKSRSKRGSVRHQARPGHRAGELVHVTLRSGFRPLRSAFVFPTVRGAIRDLNRRWKGRFRVVHFSVQSDHLHLIAEAAGRWRCRSVLVRSLLPRVRGICRDVSGCGRSSESRRYRASCAARRCSSRVPGYSAWVGDAMASFRFTRHPADTEVCPSLAVSTESVPPERRVAGHLTGARTEPGASSHWT